MLGKLVRYNVIIIIIPVEVNKNKKIEKNKEKANTKKTIKKEDLIDFDMSVKVCFNFFSFKKKLGKLEKYFQCGS